MFNISIHAPVKGATGILLPSAGGDINFNPRSREGSDFIMSSTYAYLIISIHAPVKGATRFARVNDVRIAHFNPRSREGSDLDAVHVLVAVPGISIHAPVKGATRFAMAGTAPSQISIHAPVKGATT